MEALATASHLPDGQSGARSQSSYSSATPSNYLTRLHSDDGSPKPAGVSIRQIRESMSQTGPLRPSQAMLQPPSMQPKKKSSIFGGLFATKEPTQKALNQVTAQMMAQHGSTTPGKVPHVSMEKMPEHVPKVNSKWDGVPTAVKERDKREKDRQKALKRDSTASSATRARSVESSERSGRHLRSAGTRSRDPSMSSRGRSSKTHRTDPRSPNPHKFYAQSVNSSGDLASQQRTEDNQESSMVYTPSNYSQSLRYSSSTSLPNITTSVHYDIPAPPPVPAMYRSNPGTKNRVHDLDKELKSSKTAPAVSENALAAPPVEAIPEYTSSPIATPREGSPVTPSTQQTPENFSRVRESIVPIPGSVSLESSGPKILPLPLSSSNKKKLLKQPTDAFLAGEARPLELPDDDAESPPVSRDLPFRRWEKLRGSRVGTQEPVPPIPAKSARRLSQDLSQIPDSPRSRLGLKGSMVVSTDAMPWESRQNPPALSPRSANAREPTGSKQRLPALGAFRKKES